MTTPVLNKKCHICGKQTVLEYQPFCSKKCADIDLGRWLKGTYIVHTNEVPNPDDLSEVKIPMLIQTKNDRLFL